MAFLKTSAQTIGSHPRIPHSSLYPNVPQQRSDNFQVRSVFEQMCRKCTAKSVRCNMFYPGSRAYPYRFLSDVLPAKDLEKRPRTPRREYQRAKSTHPRFRELVETSQMSSSCS